MANDRRARRRGLRGALAALLCLGVSTSAMAWDRPQWVRQLGTSDYDESHSVATDGDGNVYITGWTEGSPAGPNQGINDAWLAKYSTAGDLLWTRQLGTDSFDYSHGVATDRAGNVYITGGTEGSLGGTNQRGPDAYVAKYSTAGALRWVRQIGTSSADVSEGVATDGDGSIYISGTTAGSLGGANQGLNNAWLPSIREPARCAGRGNSENVSTISNLASRPMARAMSISPAIALARSAEPMLGSRMPLSPSIPAVVDDWSTARTLPSSFKYWRRHST